MLELGYVRRDGRSVLAHRAHRGPLRVQRDLYPEGGATCHSIIVHPPGGIAGGDRLRIEAHLGAGSAALLTTPGAGKWYRSAGRAASQALQFTVEDGAVLEWLPQESIVFNQAQAQMSAAVELSGSAVYIGWDILCLGRTASGERFAQGQVRLATEIRRDGRRLWVERGRIDGDDPLLDSPVGLAGRRVSATLLAAAPLWDSPAGAGLLADCRSVTPGPGDLAGITRLPGILIARWLGDSAEEARRYCTALWMKLRPALKQVAAQPPRIWST